MHTVVNILAGNYAAYASGLGDASWGHPQYYRTFQTLDLDGNLYLFGRGATGVSTLTNKLGSVISLMNLS